MGSGGLLAGWVAGGWTAWPQAPGSKPKDPPPPKQKNEIWDLWGEPNSLSKSVLAHMCLDQDPQCTCVGTSGIAFFWHWRFWDLGKKGNPNFGRKLELQFNSNFQVGTTI